MLHLPPASNGPNTKKADVRAVRHEMNEPRFHLPDHSFWHGVTNRGSNREHDLPLFVQRLPG